MDGPSQVETSHRFSKGCFPLRPSEKSSAPSAVRSPSSQAIAESTRVEPRPTVEEPPVVAPRVEQQQTLQTSTEQTENSESHVPRGVCRSFFLHGECNRVGCTYRHSRQESIEREESYANGNSNDWRSSGQQWSSSSYHARGNSNHHNNNGYYSSQSSRNSQDRYSSSPNRYENGRQSQGGYPRATSPYRSSGRSYNGYHGGGGYDQHSNGQYYR